MSGRRRATARTCANGHSWMGNTRYRRHGSGELTERYCKTCNALSTARCRAHVNAQVDAIRAAYPLRRSLTDYAREFGGPSCSRCTTPTPAVAQCRDCDDPRCARHRAWFINGRCVACAETAGASA